EEGTTFAMFGIPPTQIENLADSPHAGELPAGERGSKASGQRFSKLLARCPDRAHGLSRHMTRQVAPDGLDLGELGHAETLSDARCCRNWLREKDSHGKLRRVTAAKGSPDRRVFDEIAAL